MPARPAGSPSTARMTGNPIAVTPGSRRSRRRRVSGRRPTGFLPGVKIPSTASSTAGCGVLDDVHLAGMEPEGAAGLERLDRIADVEPAPAAQHPDDLVVEVVVPRRLARAGCSRRTSSRAWSRCAGRAAPGTTARPLPCPARRGRARRPAPPAPSARAGRSPRRASRGRRRGRPAPATSVRGLARPDEARARAAERVPAERAGARVDEERACRGGRRRSSDAPVASRRASSASSEPRSGGTSDALGSRRRHRLASHGSSARA